MARPQFTQPVEREQDRAVRAGELYTENETATAATGGGDQTIAALNDGAGEKPDDTETYVVSGFGLTPGQALTADEIASIGVKLTKDDGSSVLRVERCSMTGGGYWEPSPPFVVGPGENVGIVVRNYNASTVDLEGSIAYRRLE